MNESVIIAIIGIGFLFLLLSGMWIPFAVSIAGTTYLYTLTGAAGIKAIGLVAWSSLDSFVLTAIPLFILMSEILLHSGLSQQVYNALSSLVRKLPGGLLQTNIAGCAVFAAISGSSVATAAAIGPIALPQLEQRGYDPRMSAGSLAAGGTLGILIPPSIAMIIYGTLTDTPIAKLFMAGILPGLCVVIFFMTYIGVRSALNPALAPRETARMSLALWIRTIIELIPFILLIAVVLGSLYLGIATPTESAAIGCVISLLLAAVTGNLSLAVLEQSLINTLRASGGVLFIVLSAFILSYAVTLGGLAQDFAAWIASLGLSRIAILIAVSIMYIVLGCLVESMAMIVITVPLLMPVLAGAGIDTLWFGIVLVVLIECGQITPPFGINLFVIQSLSKGSYEDVVRGTLPYCLIQLFSIVVFTMFPQIVTWLPAHILTH